MRRKCGGVFAIVLAVLLTASASAAELHPMYLTGFPDGTIRPEAALSRQQLCQILLRFLPEDAPCENPGYLDVLPSQWSYLAVATMVTLGIYPEVQSAYFEPKKAVSAEEFRAVIRNAAAYLPDLSDKELQSDEETVTRKTAVRFFNDAFGRCDSPGMKGMLTWSDLSADDACYPDFTEATNTHTAEQGRWCAVG